MSNDSLQQPNPVPVVTPIAHVDQSTSAPAEQQQQAPQYASGTPFTAEQLQLLQSMGYRNAAQELQDYKDQHAAQVQAANPSVEQTRESEFTTPRSVASQQTVLPGAPSQSGEHTVQVRRESLADFATRNRVPVNLVRDQNPDSIDDSGFITSDTLKVHI